MVMSFYLKKKQKEIHRLKINEAKKIYFFFYINNEPLNLALKKIYF
jgi:hypothetical protein